MDSETMLKVENLFVTFNGEPILRDLSFSVKKGEALAVIGPNGAGKTVLFRALLGLLPFGGSVQWKDGVKIGYVPQKFLTDRTIPLTVKEFFLLKCSRFWFPKKEFVDHLAHELTLVGLNKEVLSKPLGELSGGQLQRVIVSWALIDHPDVLLFDEPTTGIDIGAEETIYNIMHRLQDERSTTVILISHDLNVVYRYAQNVLCLNKDMVCFGSPADVLTPQGLSKLYGEGGFYLHRHTR
ncbi:MAG: metal ABC transporter ATP-binding protein [Candidatus Sungbacteria bacterium]|nr:metal ABC transporter ATP-binding protein [Candidatus Sungbacteria bacterium]